MTCNVLHLNIAVRNVLLRNYQYNILKCKLLICNSDKCNLSDIIQVLFVMFIMTNKLYKDILCDHSQEYKLDFTVKK